MMEQFLAITRANREAMEHKELDTEQVEIDVSNIKGSGSSETHSVPSLHQAFIDEVINSNNSTSNSSSGSNSGNAARGTSSAAVPPASALDGEDDNIPTSSSHLRLRDILTQTSGGGSRGGSRVDTAALRPPPTDNMRRPHARPVPEMTAAGMRQQQPSRFGL